MINRQIYDHIYISFLILNYCYNTVIIKKRKEMQIIIDYLVYSLSFRLFIIKECIFKNIQGRIKQYIDEGI